MAQECNQTISVFHSQIESTMVPLILQKLKTHGNIKQAFAKFQPPSVDLITGPAIKLLNCCSKLEGTSRQAELADEEVLHIRGSITSLENSFHWPHSSPLGAHRDISPGLRHASGIIPWHPNGAPFELTIPKVRPNSLLHSKPAPVTS